MTQIDLAYGRRSIPLAFDDKQFQLLTKPGSKPAPLSDIEIGAVFDAPIHAPALDELVRSGDSVLIVVSDATRATASAQIVNLIVRRIIQAGVSPSDIAIIFATGIHRPVTPTEKNELLTPFITQRIRTIDHNAEDANNLISLGHTRNDIPVQVNRALKDFTHIIITGGIAFHYFAGFTGGRKSICPGLASAKTIELTHMLALDFEKGGRRAGVGTGLLQGNAVHQECDEIASIVGPSFGVYTVVDELGRAINVFAGQWREAHRVGCENYLSEHSLPITRKRRLVIVSCGGYPFDINLIQAHKALEMASYACEEGGTIVWVAECAEGLGRSDFLTWFQGNNSRSLEEVLREKYQVNGQTAWSLLTKAERYRIVMITELEDDVVRQMGIVPATSLTAALEEAKETSGYIMPLGAALLPIVTES